MNPDKAVAVGCLLRDLFGGVAMTGSRMLSAGLQVAYPSIKAPGGWDGLLGVRDWDYVIENPKMTTTSIHLILSMLFITELDLNITIHAEQTEGKYENPAIIRRVVLSTSCGETIDLIFVSSIPSWKYHLVHSAIAEVTMPVDFRITKFEDFTLMLHNALATSTKLKDAMRSDMRKYDRTNSSCWEDRYHKRLLNARAIIKGSERPIF
jgi:hypothetical protein